MSIFKLFFLKLSLINNWISQNERCDGVILCFKYFCFLILIFSVLLRESGVSARSWRRNVRLFYRYFLPVYLNHC